MRRNNLIMLGPSLLDSREMIQEERTETPIWERVSVQEDRFALVSAFVQYLACVLL